MFDRERQGVCHQDPEEGSVSPTLGDSAARVQEAGEACSCAEFGSTGADVRGDEFVEGMAQLVPHRLEEEPGGVGKGFFDM